MPVASITGCALQYTDSGAAPGENLLFLHAFPLDAEMWSPQVTAFAAEHRVITLSARGFGESKPSPKFMPPSLIADDAVSLLRQLRISSAVIIGLSMGGYAAFEIWRRHAAIVRAFVLADTRAGADDAKGKEAREALAKEVVEKGIGWAVDQLAPKLQRKAPSQVVDREVRRIIRRAPPAALAAALRGMALREDSTRLLREIMVPALVIVGMEDQLTPPKESRAISSDMPIARLVEIENAGHLSNLEQPAAFNLAVSDFLMRLPQRRPSPD